MAHLSPLNFRALIDRAGIVGEPREEPKKLMGRRQPIECWRCPECYATHDDEDDAAECCADDPEDVQRQDDGISSDCPICGHHFDDFDYQAAADCCMWKDLAPPTRWAIAAAVEAGQTWIESIQMHTQ
jgi:hypothetical protein